MRRIALVLLMVFPLTNLVSLDLTEGKLKIDLNEDNGRFSIIYLDDPAEGSLSLLYKDDPRTSKISINIDDNVYVLGDSFEFSKEISQIEHGIRILWTSPQLEVTQDILFISSASSNNADGLHIKLKLKNISQYSSVVAVRYLFDTYLGEESNNHFFLSTGRRLTGETELRNNLPDFIVSPISEDMQSGLQLMSSAPGITKPEYIVIANWKRLNDAVWQYSANAQRTFSSPPYSINDSAVAYYYNPKTLSTGQAYEVNLALGYYAKTGYSPDYSIRDKEISSIAEKPETKTEEDVYGSLRSDIESVRDFLNQIDAILESGENITDEKLYLLEQIIRNLEQRKSKYAEE